MGNAVTYAAGYGLVTAAILAISTVAVTLQYSVTRVPNFAQGDIMTLGAYAAVQTSILVPNLFLEAAVAVVVCAAFSFAMNYGLIQPFQRRGVKNIIILVVTAAVSLILQNVILAIYGGAPVNFKLPSTSPAPYGPFRWTERDIQIMVAAALVLLSVHLILTYTKFGKSQRAVSDDPELARVSGIDSDRVINFTWLWAGGMTGFSGFVLAASIGAFDPSFGFAFLLVIFAAAVVGGIGQAYGAMLGALLIGLAMEISAVYISSEYKEVVAFVFLIVALLIRPSGLIAARAKNIVY
ncbi:MAG TPA: branched-chain amino acid ABC transporter permease [Candidatus Dormibacteraeota bacterium]|nr:branched-chain amino acid ABC transporter permease [Candidatus Dormibacteraeota bacterium]